MQTSVTPELPAQVPALVEYDCAGEMWRCNRFDLLAVEIPMRPEHLPLFHSVAVSKGRAWLIVRRLFGLQPVVPAANTELDDLRLWGREELRAALDLTRSQLQEELTAIRGTWQAITKTLPEPEPKAAPKEHREEFQFADDELLARHGFSIRFERMEEKAWFAGRVKDFEKVLNEKFAAGLARNALMSELRIHQLDDILNNPDKNKTGNEAWRSNLKLRQELDENYQDQIKQIKELCPWAGAIAGKFTFQGVLSDITQAIQLYASRNETRLIDGIFTATEIQVECRRSTQAPEPRYRAGLVLYLNAARAGLWDPNWKPAFENSALKRIDAGWKAAFAAASEDVSVPDLEQEGPRGEYSELTKPEGERLSNENQTTPPSPSVSGASH
jgi:hypothetical protein